MKGPSLALTYFNCLFMKGPSLTVTYFNLMGTCLLNMIINTSSKVSKTIPPKITYNYNRIKAYLFEKMCNKIGQNQAYLFIYLFKETVFSLESKKADLFKETRTR